MQKQRAVKHKEAISLQSVLLRTKRNGPALTTYSWSFPVLREESNLWGNTALLWPRGCTAGHLQGLPA